MFDFLLDDRDLVTRVFCRFEAFFIGVFYLYSERYDANATSPAFLSSWPVNCLVIPSLCALSAVFFACSVVFVRFN